MAGANSFDVKVAKTLVGQINDIEGEIETLRGKFMEACKGKRERIAEVKDRAKDAGIPRGALNGYLKDQKLAKKRVANRERLDLDEKAMFEMLIEGLGDFGTTALGSAALEAVKPGRRTEREAEAAGLASAAH